jgi:hypothetical protein
MNLAVNQKYNMSFSVTLYVEARQHSWKLLSQWVNAPNTIGLGREQLSFSGCLEGRKQGEAKAPWSLHKHIHT